MFKDCNVLFLTMDDLFYEKVRCLVKVKDEPSILKDKIQELNSSDFRKWNDILEADVVIFKFKNQMKVIKSRY